MLTLQLMRSGRSRLALLALGLVLVPLGAVLMGQGAPEPVRGRATAVAAAGDAAATWGQRIQAMERGGGLRLRSSVEDTMLAGRVHDRFDQYAGEAMPVVADDPATRRRAARASAVAAQATWRQRLAPLPGD